MCKVKFNKRFVGLLLAVVVILGMLLSTDVSASSYADGGYARVIENAFVIGEDREIRGTVDVGEGVTVLYHDDDGMYYFVDCSSPSGPLQGFVHYSALQQESDTAYGVVTTSSSTYYSPNTSLPAGSVSAGENVAVLCNNGSWAYIQYNVANAQRKRAFIQSSKIYSYSQARTLFYHEDFDNISYPTVSSTKTVYSGPNAVSYAYIGSVDPTDNGYIVSYGSFYDKDGDVMYYIRYKVTGTNNYKYGYIYA